MIKDCHGAGRRTDNDPISGGRDLEMYTHGPQPGPIMSLHVLIILVWDEGVQTSYVGVREPEMEGVALMRVHEGLSKIK